jgi:hypothetical protein
LGKIPVEGRSRYEVHQVRIFNKMLFYVSLLALASIPLVAFESNIIERITLISLLAVVFWGLILLNKKGYDHIARPVYIIFASVFNGYISYREGHHLNK